MQFGDLPNTLIRKVFKHAPPIKQEESLKNDNLGYGNIYYGLIRSIRPKHVLAIGSGHGFMPVMAGLAVKDNGVGKVTFVDPSYGGGLADGTANNKIKEGKWSDPKKTREFFAKFGLEDIVTHYKQANHEFFNDYRKHRLPPISFAIIDGCHSYANAKFDLMNVLQRLNHGGIILMHDTNHLAEYAGVFGVREVLNELDDNFNVVNLPGKAGLAIVQRKGEGYLKTKHAHHIRNALCVCLGIVCAKIVGI